MRFLIRLVVSGGVLALVASSSLSASAQSFDLRAAVGGELNAFVGAGVRQVAATSTLAGTQGLFVALSNVSSASVRDPTITVSSGYDTSYFPGSSGPPILTTQPSLAPGETLSNNICCTAIPATFSMGFDSSRSVDRPAIPPTGADQTTSVSLTWTGTQFLRSGLFGFGISIDLEQPLSGVTVVSTAIPSNLDQGESLQGNGGHLAGWFLGSPVYGKTYTFSVTLHVANATGRAFFFLPHIQLNAVPLGGPECSAGYAPQFAKGGCFGPTSSVTVPYPQLDGPSPGAGQVIFSVTGGSYLWEVFPNYTTNLAYQGWSSVCNPKSKAGNC